MTEMLKIPITQFKIQFQLVKDCTFPFYHGAEMYSLLCTLLDRHPLGIDVLINPVESGKVFFRKNELYNLGLSFIGSKDDEESLTELFSNKLAQAGNNEIASFFTLQKIEKINLQTDPPQQIGPEIILRFLNPLRMPRQKKAPGKFFFDPSFFDPAYFLQSLSYRIEDVCAYLNIENPIGKDVVIPRCELKHKNLMWIDVPFEQTIGGVIGKVKFISELSDLWKWVLWVGQFLHAGRNSSFGFGRYRIENIEKPIHNISPAQNILESAMEYENIAEAFDLLKKNPHHNSLSEDKYESEFGNNLVENIKHLRNEVLTYKSAQNGMKFAGYRPDHLKGYLIPKSDGKKRALAVPDFKDRLIQKAVCDVIAPSIDKLLEDSAFAYRKGLSRISASAAINKAKKEGLRYAVKCDIEAFFDNVDWDILFEKLDILFYDDPVLPLLKQWVSQPVYFDGRVVIRDRGLPQGAVFSPVLANLYLDEFDEILGTDFKLIRYADDCLILCRSKQETENALKEAEESLNKLHLELNKNKTLVTSFDHGFQYLGLMFSKSEETENNEVQESTAAAPAQIDKDALKKNWIIHIDADEIKPVDAVTRGKPVKIERLYDTKNEREKYPIYINGYLTKVRYEGDALCIAKEEEGTRSDAIEKRIPFSQIHSVLFVGNPRISFPVVIKLKQNNIPSYFAHQNGKLYLTVLVEPRNYNIWLKQLKLSESEEFKLEIAKKIVSAKINNSAVTIERFGQKEDSEQLKHFVDIALKTDSIDVLRGIEGRSSAVFFEFYKKLLAPEWKFNGRKKHPPPDPVNAMLSTGYMLLLNHVSTALQVVGLNPEIGFYHISRGRYPALASDIVEEFRFIADRLVLYLINRKIIQFSDFTFNEKSKFPCSMNQDARKKLFEQFEMRLNNKFSLDGTDEKHTYFNYIYLKAESLLEILNEKGTSYQPLMTR